MKVAPFLFLSSVFSVASGRLVGSSDRRGLVVDPCSTKSCTDSTECDDGDDTTDDACRLEGTNMCCAYRDIPGPTTCTSVADCTAATLCNVATCNAANECEYADPCSAAAGFTISPDAHGNCGKAACSVVGTSYECTVVDPGTGCARTGCVVTPGLDACEIDRCNTVTGCCAVAPECDAGPCAIDTCTVVDSAPVCDFTNKLVCNDNEDNDCILDECQDTGGGLDPGDGECRSFNVTLGQSCVDGGAALNPGGDRGECDGNGSCIVVTTTTQATPAACSVSTDCDDNDPCTNDVCVPINDGVNPTVMTCLNPDKCNLNTKNECAEDTCAADGTCGITVLNEGGACTGGTCASGVCVAPTTIPPVTTVAATTVAATTVAATTVAPACKPGGDSCVNKSECCSNKCKGSPGGKACE